MYLGGLLTHPCVLSPKPTNHLPPPLLFPFFSIQLRGDQRSSPVRRLFWPLVSAGRAPAGSRVGNRPYSQSQGLDLAGREPGGQLLPFFGGGGGWKGQGHCSHPGREDLEGCGLDGSVYCPIVRTEAKETSRAEWVPRPQATPTKLALPVSLAGNP